MYEYLNFSTKNKVGKKLSKEKYITSANLTESEKVTLYKYLKSIEILYSFPFADGEIIVLLADYFVSERNQYALNNFVKAIAQSLPYEILLLVRCEGIIRFFIFNSESNVNDDRRSRVLFIKSSKDIILAENDFYDNMLISRLRDDANESVSAAELQGRWFSTLSNNCDKFVDDTFKYSIAKYNEQLETEKHFNRLTENNYTYEYDNCDLYVGKPLEIDDVADHRLFIEFCAYYSRVLYKDVTLEHEFSEDKWLQKYLGACSSLAKNLFCRALDGRCVAIISSAFWNNNENYIESSDCYDVEDLKEQIGYFYFDESEE